MVKNLLKTYALENTSLGQTIISIKRPDRAIMDRCQHKMDMKTKPRGSLGILEDLALQICLIKQTLNPELPGKAIYVFAGDHGVAEEGVSAFPQEVTSQMVFNFLAGGAAISVLADKYNIKLSVIDMGVNFDFEETRGLICLKVKKSTANFTKGPAMNSKELINALTAGVELGKEPGTDILGVGEMGIANTTSASAVISLLAGISPGEAAGRGTGINDKQLEHKINVIEAGIKQNAPNPSDPFDVLMKLGGFEIAGMTGMILGGASRGIPVVLDGVISTAAGLAAYSINPDIAPYLISGHKSVEQGQIPALAKMGLKPIIDFRMRLGEGSGAAITMDLVDTACKIMRDMASFEEAGVSNKSS